jgi:succinoglycan biosynthesis transport protein ExoP
VLLGDVRIEAAMQHWRRDLPLYVVTSGPIPPNPSELLGSRRLAELVAGLVANGMFVVFDSPPLLPVTDAAVLARATQGALVVTRVGSTRTDQLETSLEALQHIGARILGVVANRVKRKGKGGGYEGYYTAQPSGRRQTTGNATMRLAMRDGAGEALGAPTSAHALVGQPTAPGTEETGQVSVREH